MNLLVLLLVLLLSLLHAPLPAVVVPHSDIGTFICAVELEGLSHGKSSTTYSGISTLGSTTQFVGQYSAATAQSMRLTFSVNIQS
jgi:hypothetical protein